MCEIAAVTGWTLDYIGKLPLTRLWAFVGNWQRHPPMHRLLAMFIGYGEKQGTASASSPIQHGFEITPKMTQAFGSPCRESSLHPRIRKSVEEFQSTPAYLAWRAKMKKPPK